LLAAQPRHNARSFGAIQSDLLSLPGLDLAALVARLTLRDAHEHMAQQQLTTWDGCLDGASVGATIYAATRYHLLREALRDAAGVLGVVVGLGPFASSPASSLRMRALPGLLARLARGDDDGLLARAFAKAVAELRASYGDDLARWSYGRTQRFTIRHPLGGVKGLGRLLNRGPLLVAGDIDTVCMGNIPRDPVAGPTCIAPSYRIICDTADWDTTLSVLPGGQSGHPGSRHYADQLGLWQRGAYKPLLWSRAKVEAASVARLALNPN
jgi:penicillin G amidase